MNDQVSTDPEVGIDIDVLTNDTDPDGDTLDLISVTDPPGGTTVISRGTQTQVRYVPNRYFFGEDVFGYQVRDNHGATSTASVRVTVTAPLLGRLFSLDRKLEIADNGAMASFDGAVGCGLTAAVIYVGTAGGSAVVVGGAEGVATQGQALGAALLEETVGNCAMGLAGSIYNGVLLTVDPPDPAWRRLALAEALPRATVGRCTLPRHCAAVTSARRALVEAQRDVSQRHEALAVAANRYGNAVSAKDFRVGSQHDISMRVLSGMLADAIATKDARAKAAVSQLRAAGVRSIRVKKPFVAMALKARAAGKGVPKATADRALRKRLITTRADAVRTVRAEARRQRPADFDVLAALTRPTRTTVMRRDAGGLKVTDLVILIRVMQTQLRTSAAAVARHEKLLTAVLRCDARSPAALRSLATAAAAPAGLGGDAGAQVAWTARRLAKKGVTTGPACTG